MIAGSSALVGMARTQVDEVSRDIQGYANLSAVNQLKDEQASKLANAKVSIDKARQLTLASLQGDPEQASPWTPKSAPAVATTGEASEAGETAAPAATAEAGEVAPAPTGTAAEGSEAAPAPSATP